MFVYLTSCYVTSCCLRCVYTPLSDITSCLILCCFSLLPYCYPSPAPLVISRPSHPVTVSSRTSCVFSTCVWPCCSSCFLLGIVLILAFLQTSYDRQAGGYSSLCRMSNILFSFLKPLPAEGLLESINWELLLFLPCVFFFLSASQHINTPGEINHEKCH